MSTLSAASIGKIREWAGQRENKDTAENQTNKALKFQLLLLTDLLETMIEVRDGFRSKKSAEKA